MFDPALKYEKIIQDALFLRPAKEILLDLVHVFLEYEIPIDKITFGKASALDQRPEVPTDPDTFVQAEIAQDYDYRFPGANGFLYRRIPLGMATVNQGLEIYAPDFPFTTWDVLDQINRFMNLALLPEDVINETYDLGSVVFLLQADPGSWNWEGGRVMPVVFPDNLPSNTRITTDANPRITTDGSMRVAIGQ